MWGGAFATLVTKLLQTWPPLRGIHQWGKHPDIKSGHFHEKINLVLVTGEGNQVTVDIHCLILSAVSSMVFGKPPVCTSVSMTLGPCMTSNLFYTSQRNITYRMCYPHACYLCCLNDVATVLVLSQHKVKSYYSYLWQYTHYLYVAVLIFVLSSNIYSWFSSLFHFHGITRKFNVHIQVVRLPLKLSH